MAKAIPKAGLDAIERALREFGGSASARQILQAMAPPPAPRTLLYRLSYLVAQGLLAKEGGGRQIRYRILEASAAPALADPSPVPLSLAGKEILHHVGLPLAKRRPVGYSRRFLDSYRPNSSGYLSHAERAHLASIGRQQTVEQPAGTYAKRIMSRLLIDLAWNSSRLEGNTYSLLDTRRLIELGQEAEGRPHLEAQMILNHKDAIEFLVTEAEVIGFNRYTILNLHGLLANNLLADPTAAGRLRYLAVGIESSAFHPLEVPQLIEECFDQILATASTISDPFEQAFFVMVQLP